MITLEQCRGCRDDFYNGQGAARCWHAKTGTMKKRYRIGTWTQPTQRFAFTEVYVPSCFHQTGQHFCDKLPDFVKLADVVRRVRRPSRPGEWQP